MLQNLFRPFFEALNEFMHRPVLVIAVCSVVLFFSLIIEGSLFQLWSLHQNSKEVLQKTAEMKADTEELNMKIINAADLDFLEVEARERFDLVSEGDLVFVFSGWEDDG